MKKFVCFMLTLVALMPLFSAVPASAYNEQDTVITEPVQLEYAYTSSVSTDLYISGDKATCTSIVTGKSTATKIEATQYLEKKVLGRWKEVDHWDKTVNSDEIIKNSTEYTI